MKKTLILLLTLVIAISMTFVACDNQVKAQDKGSSESTDSTPVAVVPFDETTAKAVETKNEEAVSLVEDSSKELEELIRNLSSLTFIGEQTAKSGKTFTLVSADVLNNFIEKNTGNESNLTPNQYEYIKSEIGFTEGVSTGSMFPFTLKIEYKASGKEKVTFDGFQEYFGSNDQLLYEMFALTGTDPSIMQGGATSSASWSFKNTITQMIKVAAASPTAKIALSISDGTNTCAISWYDIMGGKDRTISLNDTWTLTKNKSTLLSLKYDVSVTFSEDFDANVTFDLNKMQPTKDPEFTGKLSVSLKKLEASVADRFVFTSTASAEVDFTNETAKADFSLAEKIDGKEYLRTEFSLAGSEAVEVKKLSDVLTIKSLKIEGVSYEPESVLEYIKKVE